MIDTRAGRRTNETTQKGAEFNSRVVQDHQHFFSPPKNYKNANRRANSDGQGIERMILLSENIFIPRLSSKVGHWKSPSCFQEAAEIVGCS